MPPYFDAPDFRSPPVAHTFVFHNCGRNKTDGENAKRPVSQPLFLLQPSSCQKSFTLGHVCNKFGRTEIYSSNEHHISDAAGIWFNPNRVRSPPAAHEAKAFANPLSPHVEPQILDFASSVSRKTPDFERWRSARDMFMQYDIRRPSGWFSDISLSGDGNASPRRYCRYCHVCSAPTWAPTHCSSCGHRLCEKCKCEVPGGGPQAHAAFSHHPSPVISRDGPNYVPASSVDADLAPARPSEVKPALPNPESQHEGFIDARNIRSSHLHAKYNESQAIEDDRKVAASRDTHISSNRYRSRINEENSEQIQKRSTQPIKTNPFLANDKLNQVQGVEDNVCTHSMNQVECDDPMCKATHTGHYPFRHSVSCSKHGSEQRRRAPGSSEASNRPLEGEFLETSTSQTGIHQSQADNVHRHHSAGFHSHHHIAEHLSSAVGHNAYDLLAKRKEQEAQPTSPKASVEPITHLRPLSKPTPVTQIDSFQWSQDVVPPGHPERSGTVRQPYPPSSEDAMSTSDPRPHMISNEATTYGEDFMSSKAAVDSKERDFRDESKSSRRDNGPPKTRLASIPSWLKNPSKEPADATSYLHHVDTANHEVREHDHGYPSTTIADEQRGRTTIRSANPARKAHKRTYPRVRSQNDHEAVPQERSRPVTAELDRPPSSLPKVSGSRHPTSGAQDAQSLPDRKQRGKSLSVSKRRQIFEFSQDRTNTPHSAINANQGATSTAQSGLSQSRVNREETKGMQLRSGIQLDHEESTPSRSPYVRHRQQGSNEIFTPPTRRPNHEFGHEGTENLAQASSETEIAKPTPIAPPNHECVWKEQYLALTAEIRQLKAEISTRTSLKGSDMPIPEPGYAQRGDDLNLLGVTVILHFTDRDDIVISTGPAHSAVPGH
ncbi:hypothetical protein F4777DRAFT_529620 [Nemania sp. FL0916]|nr:hypothetical protein F4777DRAFT_529620 [Nemania sp. FL0916]